MPSRLRPKITYGNVVATLALFLAMSGGAAYAASHYLITSTKQISPKVLKTLKGANGKNGANGAAGATGAAGPGGPAGAGSPGPEGKAGSPGESVTNTTAAKTTCKEGGAEFKVGAGTATHACSGEKGLPGKEGNIGKTLASGATETGAWAYAVPAQHRCFEDTGKGNFTDSECKVEGTHGTSNFEKETVFHGRGRESTAISFSIPLAQPLSNSGCEEPSKSPCQVHYVTLEEVEEHKAPAQCPGTVAEPSAAKGNLCVYGHAESEIVEKVRAVIPPGFASFKFPAITEFGAGINGALVQFETEEGQNPIIVNGSWAVTAE
jgi:hypothetical protein